MGQNFGHIQRMFVADGIGFLIEIMNAQTGIEGKRTDFFGISQVSIQFAKVKIRIALEFVLCNQGIGFVNFIGQFLKAKVRTDFKSQIAGVVE